jgi:hypothetical protein
MVPRFPPGIGAAGELSIAEDALKNEIPIKLAAESATLIQNPPKKFVRQKLK